jgi:uncharacterized metal-binding protein YceD (DUF177 family)
MKPRLNPIEISLKDLPAEGRAFTYTRESGELSGFLEDLIDKNPYEVSFQIMPVGNAFTLQGQLTTGLNLACSLCAIDFKFPVKQKLNELLVVQRPMAKGEHQGKANHAHEWDDSGPDYILLDSGVFNVAEYIHEVIGLAEPMRPLGKPDCDIACENLPENVKKLLDPELAREQDPIKTNPFRVLEKIKLKS